MGPPIIAFAAGVGTWRVGPAGPADFLILSVLAGRAGRPSKFVWPAGPISARFRWAGRADCKFSLADFGRPNFLLAGRADVDFFMAKIGRRRPTAADGGRRGRCVYSQCCLYGGGVIFQYLEMCY